MILGRVIGTVVSTRKDERLTGFKLLVVETLQPGKKTEVEEFVAVDTVGAGVGETVLVVMGSPASRTVNGADTLVPVDAAIIGIVDTVEMTSR
ncbi:EutN/CcmL family microcompartment protein [Desulfofundulus salinus]|uniref:Ethanolamine utilization protein EutN n=1 Tax=Desulfofundulus salinus TaxID=2419843 RepID=A0A494WWH2_9FIRM|nr:EutN/CcmL family microcompartment protein [Desulfofundulus salinum]RKO67859.1 ethanolamine utilization protein EutN [Desulfofundulus salinum]